MGQILEVVLQNLPLVYVPAVGAVLAMVVLRVKKRYVNQGYFFMRPSVSSLEHQLSAAHDHNMPYENQIDLEIAFRKFHELALADGDLGYAYWYQVGQLLRRAAGMQAEIDALREELERCRANQRTRR